jgi:hypothetical protein
VGAGLGEGCKQFGGVVWSPGPVIITADFPWRSADEPSRSLCRLLTFGSHPLPFPNKSLMPYSKELSTGADASYTLMEALKLVTLCADHFSCIVRTYISGSHQSSHDWYHSREDTAQVHRHNLFTEFRPAFLPQCGCTLLLFCFQSRMLYNMSAPGAGPSSVSSQSDCRVQARLAWSDL